MKVQAVLLAAAVLAGCASYGSSDSSVDAPARVSNGALVGPTGMTLYTFDKDPANTAKSVCNDKCATNWPPLAASNDAKATGDYSIITRDDGAKQWAYKSKPLYYWAKDSKPGDRTGDGINNVWHVATP